MPENLLKLLKYLGLWKENQHLTTKRIKFEIEKLNLHGRFNKWKLKENYSRVENAIKTASQEWKKINAEALSGNNNKN